MKGLAQANRSNAGPRHSKVVRESQNNTQEGAWKIRSTIRPRPDCRRHRKRRCSRRMQFERQQLVQRLGWQRRSVDRNGSLRGDDAEHVHLGGLPRSGVAQRVPAEDRREGQCPQCWISPAEMFAKLKAAPDQWDIALVTSGWFDNYVKEGLLVPIDESKVTGLETIKLGFPWKDARQSQSVVATSGGLRRLAGREGTRRGLGPGSSGRAWVGGGC